MTPRTRYEESGWLLDALDVLEPRCAVKDCQWVSVREFSGPFGDRGYCRRHVTAYRMHYEILERIRKVI